MRVVGLNWGVNTLYENPYGLPSNVGHDTAAVLLIDGDPIAAIEQERLDRIKHSNKAPIDAVQSCLEIARLKPSEIDCFAHIGDEDQLELGFRQASLRHPRHQEPVGAREFLRNVLSAGLGEEVPPEKLCFVPHHLSHAFSAAGYSGFDRCLVFVADAQGDNLSGLIATAAGLEIDIRRTLSIDESLGIFYIKVIEFLGYGLFDEYKVMGLAPHGDAGTYRSLFQTFFTLLDGGRYTLNFAELGELYTIPGLPRRHGQPFAQVQCDVAASLQETLERIVLHVLEHERSVTGECNLAMAGGVALNCTMNGRILASGLFDRVFAQPAAHDAGCAVGAALAAEHFAESRRPRALRDLYLGRDIETADGIEHTLERWPMPFRRVEDPAAAAADCIAADEVIGWVQGRSEFGPRALGARSILADPRQAANRERINAMVKRRESYRPFAPSILAEEVVRWFDLPCAARLEDLAYMIQTVQVKTECRPLIPAITHVDGSARPQAVFRHANPLFWRLIDQFRNRTNIPIVLNTSLNNNVEPIADSVEDVLATFVTARLDRLFVGPYLVDKPEQSTFGSLFVHLPGHVRLVSRYSGPNRRVYEMGSNHDLLFAHPVSGAVYDMLRTIDGTRTVRAVLEHSGVSEDVLWALWSRRLVRLSAWQLTA